VTHRLPLSSTPLRLQFVRGKYAGKGSNSDGGFAVVIFPVKFLPTAVSEQTQSAKLPASVVAAAWVDSTDSPNTEELAPGRTTKLQGVEPVALLV